MTSIRTLVAIAVIGAACKQPLESGDGASTISPADATTDGAVIENATMRVTFGADASLSVLVKATGYVWSAPAPAPS